MFYKSLLRKRDNSTHKIYSRRLHFLRTWVGLKAISHIMSHVGKLILFEHVRQTPVVYLDTRSSREHLKVLESYFSFHF